MTGFGRAEGALGAWSWAVEARSVNGRNLEVRFRGPPGFEGLERTARDGAQSPGMTTILSADGLIEIPEVFRKTDALKPGQCCDIERVGQGDYRVRVAAEPPGGKKKSLVEVLLRCPEKDGWVEPDRSERTSLNPPALFSE